MKRKILNILTLSSIITTIGFIMDGDPVEPSMFMRFVEFFGMIGIVSLLVSFIYLVLHLYLKMFREHNCNKKRV